MAAALPVSKLVGLLVKTLAKPMAKRIKHEAHRSPTSSRVLTSIGQGTHQVTSRMTIWASGYKVRKINPLEEDEAQKRGAELLGESIVFLVAGTVVVVEYNSSKTKEKRKEEKRLTEVNQNAASLEARLHAIDNRLVALEEQIKLNRRTFDNNKSSYKTPVQVPYTPSPDTSIETEDASSHDQSQSIWRRIWPFS